jgi:hypothetical protein
MFAGKTGAYPSEALLSGAPLGQAPSLPANIRLGYKKITRDKRSGLLQKFVIYDCKRFYNIGPC